MSEKSNFDDLEEGTLYVYKKGVLQEIETDPDDLMKKIKITESAFFEASQLQNRMRKVMSGYRPDISTVCSALVKHGAGSPMAVDVVKQFTLELYKSIDEGGQL